MAVVQHVESMALEGNHFGLGQVRTGPMYIDVPANGRHRRNAAQGTEYGWIAHIPGMENMVDPTQGSERLRPQQTVRIGNDSDHRSPIISP